MKNIYPLFRFPILAIALMLLGPVMLAEFIWATVKAVGRSFRGVFGIPVDAVFVAKSHLAEVHEATVAYKERTSYMIRWWSGVKR